MSVGENKCAACGQWAGHGHRCPTQTLSPFGTESVIRPTPAHHENPLNHEVSDRVHRAEEALASGNPSHTGHPATPAGIASLKTQIYAMVNGLEQQVRDLRSDNSGYNRDPYKAGYADALANQMFHLQRLAENLDTPATSHLPLHPRPLAA